jgi:predicted amidohydrolase YtcJ
MRALLFLLGLSLAPGAVAGAPADVVLVNGRVYTLDAARRWAEGLAIEGERIVAVGSSAEIRKLAGPKTRVVDLKGAFVSPGFNDAHVHMDATGALLVGVNLLDVHSEAPFVERVRGAAARLPRGSWIVRGDWGAYEQWAAGTPGAAPAAGAPSGPFTPDRRMIDAVSPDHPVFVNRFDRSMFLANSLALKLAGVTESTTPPPGGEIVKDATGRLTGILKGAAADLVRAVIPPIGFEQRLAQVRAVLREAREGGVTTMQDLSTPEQVMAYQELRRKGELTARINIRPQLYRADDVAALGLSRGFGDDWLRLIGFKAWVDGIMGNSSALFFAPFQHDPRNRGILLDVYKRVLTEEGLLGTDHRWRVIHAQHVHPDDLARFGRLKLVAEVNPYHVADDMRWMEERIGRERATDAYAFRVNLVEAGHTRPADLLKARVLYTVVGGRIVYGDGASPATPPAAARGGYISTFTPLDASQNFTEGKNTGKGGALSFLQRGRQGRRPGGGGHG